MDYEEIEALVGVLRNSRTLTELEVRSGDRVVRVRRAYPAPAVAASAVTAPARPAVAATLELPDPAARTGTLVTSHLVGIFHASRSVPASVGDSVQEGQVLGQIEAMRLMSDCPSTASGIVVAAFVADGQPVEYGQPLFEIDPA